MKIREYLKDKIINIVLYGVFGLTLFLLLRAFKTDIPCIISLEMMFLIILLINFICDYHKRNSFYSELKKSLEELDRKLLVVETIKNPDFIEAQIMMDALYDVCLDSGNEINRLHKSVSDFKEYVEMWIHEVKLPLSGLLLMNYNKNTDLDKQKAELKLLEKYLDNILYYVRSGVSDKDYLMKKVVLEDMVNNVVKKEKELLIGNHIQILKEPLNYTVVTDSKWMEFVLGQILNNSIKYVKENPSIKFTAKEYEDRISLEIEDNGIGISKSDLPYVFDKSFTGENGRLGQNSTGMGLYICSKLCKKLGHTMEIESEQGIFTRVIISFGKNNFYNEVM